MPVPLIAAPRELPEPLARLSVLALDMHWTWNHAGDSVWERLDEQLWELTQNPWLLLQYVSNDRLEALASDASFLQDVGRLWQSRERYRASPPWRPSGDTPLPRVAYFSMEFGLHEALPLYAGGLGILAGDYLKTASDLAVPVIGIGILWQQGYFRQVIDAEGRQIELYPFNEPVSLPIQPVADANGDRLSLSLAFPGRTIRLRAWQVTVGRTMLYLLDSNDPLNAPADRGLTSALYGGSTEVRLLQEIILGIGGWRLVESLGLDVEICHLNEGHAAFVVVERARHFMRQHAVPFREALWATRAGNVFTTHTAVSAGFDTFQLDDFERYRPYFEAYVQNLGVSWNELLALGCGNAEDPCPPFNMAWLAMRGCAWVNGVSRLHGDVSRRLFSPLFPRWPESQVPVGHVTNGVHVPSWDSPSTDALWTAAAGKERWRGDVSAVTESILRLSDEDLWSLRSREREDLVQFTRARLLRKLARHGSLDAASRLAATVLDPNVLTLGFARRFAAYKRPNLLLSDPDRLLKLLGNAQRPVQLIVAGKAHPHDAEGKRMIQQWVQFAARPEVRSRVAFVEDYDIRVATELVQGVDVWINTPRRPWEASGTSGMKVLVNGGLNLSTLDGWWAEAFGTDHGWAIGDALAAPDDDVQDADDLYRMLETEVVPAFYERDASGLPRRWIARIRSSMAHLAPRFSSARMLQEYVESTYVPAALSHRRRANIRNGIAAELVRWSDRLHRHWPEIRFGETVTEIRDGQLVISVSVNLGRIPPEFVRVELYAESKTDAPLIVPMQLTEDAATPTKATLYRATFETERSAEDFTPRIVPYHQDARVPIENPLIAWQR
jgi:starch phosphorylase